MIEIPLRDRFRTACGTGERSKPRIRPICGSFYPQESDSGHDEKAQDSGNSAIADLSKSRIGRSGGVLESPAPESETSCRFCGKTG